MFKAYRSVNLFNKKYNLYQCRQINLFSPNHAQTNNLFKDKDIEPFESISSDLNHLYSTIRNSLKCSALPLLSNMSTYYFDGSGKSFRPASTILLAKAFLSNNSENEKITHKQNQIAVIAEMIHVASLIHDDIIDEATTRRLKPTLNTINGNKK
ncbi:hypothetical protein A3Q56_07594, partial [Intoshia linei]